MSSTIKAIDRTTVHRICSGQVVLSLGIAVKELVENAIDAGATTVEVKLREYGSELIEVSDNGHGVHPDNFEGLTLKHHTSKLRDFSDLMGVETFGFRGEALSSLCALSELSVSTRHKTVSCGSNLKYDRNGKILENTPCARQIGSTISLANIFHTLPVRHKEFHRNLKKEFNKMLQLLYAYCMVSTGVRITCTNQTKKGSKQVVVATQASNSVKGNVSCIFGAKQLSSLLELKTILPSPEVLEELKTDEEACSIFQLDGLVSSCAHGLGRSAPDRQFYFINSRPCDPSKISKVVNEVYHQYNLHQYPFVYLNIKVARESVDVNVTPDKRQIFLDNEKILISIVKASLERIYKSIPSTFTLNNIPSRTASSATLAKADNVKPNLSIFSQWRSKNDSTSKRNLEDSDSGSNNCKVMKLDDGREKQPFQPLLTKFITKVSLPDTHAKDLNCRNDNTCVNINPEKSVLERSSDEAVILYEHTDVSIAMSPCAEKVAEISAMDDLAGTSSSSFKLTSQEENCGRDDPVSANISSSPTPDTISKELTLSPPQLENPSENTLESHSPDTTSKAMDMSPPQTEDPAGNNPDFIGVESTENSTFYLSTTSSKSVKYDSYEERGKRYVMIPTDIAHVRTLCQQRVERDNKIDKILFRAVIDPSKNDQAEDELRREITKDKFQLMEIIGQFNLGFIVTKLGKDMFIVDQHASDEKFNFETLQKTTVIKNQKLVVPQQLELTAANESVLTDNLEVFKKNGFEFKVDEDAPPTKKVSMTAVPLSNNRVFGKEDVDELLFMLQDASDRDMTCRPSGVRAMFASRACRKSVMVGTPLDFKEMRRLVSQMGTIEHPWNCPHGRPTMRHLVNIELVKKV